MPFKNESRNLQNRKKINEYICWKTNIECKYNSTEGLNKIIDIIEDSISNAEDEVQEFSPDTQPEDKMMETVSARFLVTVVLKG